MAAPALAIGTMAPVIAAHLRVARVTVAATGGTEAEIGAVTGAIGAVTAARKRVARKAAGRRSRRRATRAGRHLRQRRRRSSHAGLRRTLADRCGANHRHNHPSTTTEASARLACVQSRPQSFQIPGGFYCLRKT